MTEYLIVGGGTGGHVLPAIALADELVRRGVPASEILFLGAARGMERDAVPAAGYEIELLPGRGITRSISFENVKSAFAIMRAIWQALRIVRTRRPMVIIGFGGYASVPGMVAGTVLRVPRIVHEQNAAPGWANRLSVRLGAKPTVGFAVPQWPKAAVVGNPVRPAFVAAVHVEAQPAEVVVVGGSLGARTLNNVGIALAEHFQGRSDVRLSIIAGARDTERVAAALADNPTVEIRTFVDDLADRYARASVVIARSGAITVSELACVGVASILIPLPGAPGDHQTANAQWLAHAGGAECIPDGPGTIAACVERVDALLGDRATRSAIAVAAKSMANPGAAAALADIVSAAGE